MMLSSCRLSTRAFRLLVVSACGLIVVANWAFFIALNFSVFVGCENDKGKAPVDDSSELDQNRLIANEKVLTNYAYEGFNEIINCTLSKNDMRLFPSCQEKIGWMRGMWQVDPCYKVYGVDGSDCSILNYLSEVEGWCPKKNWQRKPMVTKARSNIVYANTTTDLKGLMCILVDPNEREAYTWIRRRVRRMWSGWVSAIFSLEKKQDLSRRVKKKILLYLGFAANKTGWNFVEGQSTGGPLGEMLQWTDLITTLYILGHDIIVTSELEDLQSILEQLPAVNAPCQNLHQLPIDIIYIDIVGLKQFRDIVKDGYPKFKCLVRVLDSFGTEPEFNSAMISEVRKLVSPWTGLELDTQQFFTFFPHSPDNSFMGFVAEQRQKSEQTIEKKDIALVYGKRPEFFQNKGPYLDLISKFFEIHTTVPYGGPFIPPFVKNHGLLPGHQLHKLLRAAKVFVGMGFPYEGPAPLEAIAEGAVFINPKFKPPRNRDNIEAFYDKPTRRGLTSQHPYAEQFIGEPYVYTVNIYSYNDVMEALNKIKQITKFKPYLPYEYTEEGMLQRMNAYVENQNFCLFQRQPSKWPPPEAVSYLLGEHGMSCKDVCSQKGLICERSYFREINSVEAFKHWNVSCSGDYGIPDILVPAFDTISSKCILQNDDLLYSCVGEHLNLRRLCPCRTYIKGQTALCVGCDK